MSIESQREPARANSILVRLLACLGVSIQNDPSRDPHQEAPAARPVRQKVPLWDLDEY
jgi:hypothetical protein